MRYINNRNKEPQELSDYRDNTPGASYDGFRDKEIVRKSLIEEQGYICAYCMGKLDLHACTIEHYISQERHDKSPYTEEEHKKQSLLYSNMSAVCINSSEHCDKKRGNIPLHILNPHKPDCEQLITYNTKGEIIAAGRETEKVKQDICTLGLNCKRLINSRNAAWDEVWGRFKKQYDKKRWTQKLLLEYAQFYKNKKQRKGGGLKFHAYCNFIVWYFEFFASKQKK